MNDNQKLLLAVFPVYADEASHETDRHGREFTHSEVLIPADAAGRFGGLVIEGHEDRTLIDVEIGDRLVWSVPLSAGMFSALCWGSREGSQTPVRAGDKVRIDVFGPWKTIALVVLKKGSGYTSDLLYLDQAREQLRAMGRAMTGG